MKYGLAALIIMSFFSCRHRQEVKAMIFERREITQNRLLLKYKYMVEGKTYIDSAFVRNIVIGSDSINIIIDPANAQKSLPDF
ncbi:hypothetical protein [Segetibacter koreensis]|uniref:hypothetical protein n=1 Tax=Segetibacter koreensis TaxID=398037 RepID=UPI0003633621|nr:hypothetical protein [Segetibacter koreensis]